MRKLFALSTITAIVAAQAENTVGREVSVMQFIYHNNGSFTREMERAFNVMDRDKDGVLPVAEAVQSAMKLSEKDPSIDPEQMKQELANIDSDKNGNITFGEYLATMTTSFNRKIMVDAPICSEAKAVLETCQRSRFSLKSFKITFAKKEAKLIYSQCVAGLSMHNDFRTERCLVAAKSVPKNCAVVKQCVDEHFMRNKEQSIIKDRKDLETPLAASRFLTAFGYIGALSGVLIVFLGLMVDILLVVGAGTPIAIAGFLGLIVGMVLLSHWQDAELKVMGMDAYPLVPYVKSFCDEFHCYKVLPIEA